MTGIDTVHVPHKEALRDDAATATEGMWGRRTEV